MVSRILIALLLTFSSVAVMHAQDITSLRRAEEQRNREIDRNVREEKLSREGQMDTLVNRGGNVTVTNSELSSTKSKGRMTLEDKQRLEPNLSDRQRFEVFLRQPKTGLIRLFQNPPCEINPKRLIVNVSCENNGLSFIGGGSYYSFHKKTHLLTSQTDLQLKDNVFFARGAFAKDALEYRDTGVYVQGILVNLGENILENLTLESGGIKQLSSFLIVDKFENLEKLSQKLSNTITLDGYNFGESTPISVGNIYGLQTSLYRRRGADRYEHPRISVTIIFQVLRQENDKSLTILWKELSRTKTAKIR